MVNCKWVSPKRCMSQKSHATDTGRPAGTPSTHHAGSTYAAGAVIPALRQRFFDRGLIAVTVLRKPGVGGNNFEQCAPILQLCVSNGLQTSLVRTAPHSCRRASASLEMTFSQTADDCPPEPCH